MWSVTSLGMSWALSAKLTLLVHDMPFIILRIEFIVSSLSKRNSLTKSVHFV